MQTQKYVGYYRVSTRKQEISGLGLEAQRKTVSDFLSNYGGELIAEFTEIESGGKADRAEFQKASDLAELTNSKLLVAKLDRLSRDVLFIEQLKRSGVGFTLCDFPEIQDGLLLTMLAAISEHELKQISLRTRNALRAAKERGTVLGNPFLSAQRNRDVAAANNARVQKQRSWQGKILKVIRHLEDTEGIKTCQALANALNERGLRTARGKEFSVPIVSRIKNQKTGSVDL